MEDFVTWVDSSAIKKHIMEYNEMVIVINILLNILILTQVFFFFFFQRDDFNMAW